MGNGGGGRFRSLVDHGADLVTVLDAERRIRHQSGAARWILDRDPEAATGDPLLDHVHPADGDRLGAALDALGPGARSDPLEVRLRGADGSWRRVETVASRPADGPVEGYVLTSRDVATRRGREEKLEALHGVAREMLGGGSAEAVCRMAVEASREVLDLPVSGIHLLDEAEEALVPVATTEGVTDIFEEPPTYTARDTLVWEAFRDGRVRVIDDMEEVREELPNPDTPVQSGILLPLGGHGVFLTTSLEPRDFDAMDVSLARLLAASTETALDRVRYERTLETLHETTRRLVAAETTEEIAEIVADAIDRIYGFPVNGVRLHDEEREALVPVAVPEATVEALGDRPVYEPGHPIWRVFESGEPAVYPDVDGIDDEHDRSGIESAMYLPIEGHGTISIGARDPDAFEESDRQLATILAANAAVAIDRVEGNRRLRERRDELARQNERLEEFASVVSHDLKNPLTVAAGNLELLETDDEKHRAAIEEALDRMERITDDLLTLARQGRRVDETEVVELAEVLEGCWRTVDTGEATLEVDGDLAFRADPGRLKQVFENLFRNAVEHGGDDVTVRAGVLPGDRGLYVEDDGPGIPEDDREAVFESGHTTAADGTGFGLSIVKGIVEAHGWTIAATESEEGGARFEISFAGDSG